MSITESPDAATEEGDASESAEAPPAEKKKRSNVVPALIIAVGLIVGGFLMKPSPAPATEEAEAAEEEVIPGELVALEPMTLNLSDGHYLRLGMALELIEGVPAKEFEETGATNRFRDLVIDRVADLPSDQFATAEGRDELKELLRDGGHELFEEEFVEIYLTELVVQ